ncbi:low affinity iron permease family protein [Phenylobacterium sp.]|uniref:low affinity iron permease family protein n=1 Tax=Phenylobacterium sp. TaxID=1871053 RepID=UPI002732F93E|nr:low affinity iron permease family protein [Phenylobacterium sp.]MDP3852315.1 low affinity iron permease family protein [Phenylobacterium sp.]
MNQFFTRFASGIARWTGRPFVFIACCGVVITWGVTGPIFGYSDTWQLVINTGTTIVTFLMVFLIQNTQNRDSDALQAKLDELIRVTKADNYFIGIENLPQDKLEEILTDLDKLAPHLRQQNGRPISHKPKSKAEPKGKTPTGARAKPRAPA